MDRYWQTRAPDCTSISVSFSLYHLTLLNFETLYHPQSSERRESTHFYHTLMRFKRPSKAWNPTRHQDMTKLQSRCWKRTAVYLNKRYIQSSNIFENEQFPEDWLQDILVKVPKKGDLSNCDNWREIILLYIPVKLLCKVLLNRFTEKVDNTLCNAQAGFRPGRSVDLV